VCGFWRIFLLWHAVAGVRASSDAERKLTTETIYGDMASFRR
jgi:phosphohistidine phosphatase SixA